MNAVTDTDIDTYHIKCSEEEALASSTHDEPINTNTPTTATKPQRNTKQEQQQKLVLVHLGKTAGSSITCRLKPSVYHSGKGDSGCNSTKDYHPSAIADAVVERIHLAPAFSHRRPNNNHNNSSSRNSNFLVTVRNPLERIVSWFYYLHPDYLPQKRQRHIKGCQDYAVFFRCWDSIQSLTEDGLSSHQLGFATSGGGGGGATAAAAASKTTSTTTKTTTTATGGCRRKPSLALDMITGRQKCWHNYFNYNFTYGRLVQHTFWEEKQQTAATTLLQNNNTANNNINDKIVIYAIRTEHLEEDWNAINILLGGTSSSTNTSSSSTTNILRKNHHHSPTGTTLLSEQGRSNLCLVLCDELQIYKNLLALAVNIDEKQRTESLDELLLSCPTEPRGVRNCSSSSNNRV